MMNAILGRIWHYALCLVLLAFMSMACKSGQVITGGEEKAKVITEKTAKLRTLIKKSNLTEEEKDDAEEDLDEIEKTGKELGKSSDHNANLAEDRQEKIEDLEEEIGPWRWIKRGVVAGIILFGVLCIFRFRSAVFGFFQKIISGGQSKS